MKAKRMILSVFPLLVAGMLSGCSSNQAPEVTDNIRKSLDQAGFKDVSVSEDREKGVVTLTGNVPTDSDKQQAESIAKSNAPNLVVADQVSVRPPGNESEAKAVDSDLDKAIEKNLDATLIKHRLKKDREVRREKRRGDSQGRCAFTGETRASRKTCRLYSQRKTSC